MGRSYSFHPFTAQQPAAGVQGSAQRLGNGNDEDKTKLTQQAEELPNAPKPYRQPNAETVRRYRQKATARKKTAKSARAENPKSRAKTAAQPGQQRRAATVASPSLAAKPNAPAAERTARKPLRKRVAAKAAKVTSVVAGAGMLAASALMKRRANKKAAKAKKKQQK